MINLGPVGVWTFAFDQLPLNTVRAAAADIEALGYGAIWIGEATGRESLTHAALLCDATEHIVIASGIARVGERSPRVMKAAAYTLAEASGGRFLLGLGGSNQLTTDNGPAAAMASYLDDYDNAPYTTPPSADAPPVVLGAQGPAMLRVAAARTQGSHTFCVTPEHTRWARTVLGPEPLLCPEQAVIVETNPDTARVIARDHLRFYLQLPHFQANFTRAGFSPTDWANDGTDRLIDALVAWGDPDTIGQRIQAHLDAGANHVCIQPLQTTPGAGIETLRHLAPTIETVRPRPTQS